MHHTLPNVLTLAPDSLSSLGELDNESLSELWSVFTRCKDNLQNGRRLENLSWRLWFDSGRRETGPPRRTTSEQDCADAVERQKATDAGWSDPEWEETDSDNDSEQSAEDESNHRASRASTVEKEVAPTQAQRGRTVSVPTAAFGASTRTALPARAVSKEWRAAPTISGDSLQRMITDSSILPAISLPPRPRSLNELPLQPPKPALGSRGNSAPNHLNDPSHLQSSLNVSSKVAVDNITASPISTDVPQPESPPRPSKAAIIARPESPTLIRTAPSSSRLSGSTSTMPPPPVPTRAAETAQPARRRSSVKLARSTSARKSVSASGAAPPPLVAPKTSAQLERAPSEIHLKRNLSTAEVAASFKPQSFTQGFEVLNPIPPQSLPSQPQVGRIAPPPTPAVHNAVLAASPPPSRLPSGPGRNGSLTSPDKVPPPPSTSSGPGTAAARTPQPGPSALKMTPKLPGTSKKIFFISSPNSEESDEDRNSCFSRDSVPVGSVPKVGSPLQQTTRPPVERSTSSQDKGKQVEREPKAKADDEDEWDDEDSESGSSSGWGSEYSTESDVARNATANGPVTRPMAGRSKSAVEPGLFAKRPPSMVHLSPSLSDSGGPGELKRRPPGLLSQLFHPDQFLDDADDAPSSEMKRCHKSMSSLPSMTSQRDKVAPPAKPRGLLGDRLTMTRPPTAPTYPKKGKPEDVELESSSEEEDDEETHVSKNETAAALVRKQRLAEIEQAAAIAAPPQTPRTTRRAMLATELSESLRRNLLWERQTRNRILGGAPRPPVMPGHGLPQRSSSTQQLAPPVVASDSAAAAPPRAPYPSPANAPPPAAPTVSHNTVLPRRATLATDLSRASQFPKNRPVDSSSEISDSSDEDDDDQEPDVSGDMYTATALGRGVW
ncbi:uncharacterized protein JCM15063_000733 [Sporobolomyces koalae]|uniref:uncharacterized protein n=1 Tax=Sporobolomyces koalae TaxID=500713 RepID=UPI003180D0FE